MKVTEVQNQNVMEAYGMLPLTFVVNKGQSHSSVKYQIQRPGCGIYFTREKAAFVFMRKNFEGDQEALSLFLQFLNANPEVRIEGRNKEMGKVNYFIGSDPKKWLANLPTYREVVYRDLWPGVDLIFYGENGRLKYDFVLQPGTKVDDIQLTYRGSDDLSLDDDGNLLIHTTMGVMTEERPFSYQMMDGQRVPVASRFIITQSANGEKIYGFQIEHGYNLEKPLVIDPMLIYSTYLGGSADDVGFGIAVDALGNAYVTGSTASTNFPTTPGAFQTTFGGDTFDTFVTKLNPTGTALIYSTYLGGSSDDEGFGIAIDSLGNAYVTGRTSSTNFPTTVGAFQTTLAGNFDAFVTKLNATGSALIYSTYLGGSADDEGLGIAIDSSGNAYLTGFTFSTNFPTTLGAFQTANAGSDDAFVTKLNATGSALIYSTYLGGSFPDVGRSITIDGSGNAYVTGLTTSTNFPTTAGAFQTALASILDAFVTKLNATGSALIYSTYLGGNGDDEGFGIAIDSSGNAYVTGFTQSTNFPTTAGAFQTALNGPQDAFVTKLNATGSALIYSTYLGGSNVDSGTGIVIDSSGNAYVTGDTFSTNFPITPDAFQTANAGSDDAFVTILNTVGNALVFSTYLGGSGSDGGSGIALDSSLSVYVTGGTSSTNFPVTPGAFQTTFGGVLDAFVTKISTVPVPTPPPISLLLTSIALEELALAHIMNAEAEKLQLVLGTLTPTTTTFSPAVVSLTNLLAVNASVQRTFRDSIMKEHMLEFKFENILDLIAITPLP